jgi:hypothetical protein
MQAHVARIRNHVPRQRASSSELRIRSLFFHIDLHRASVGAVICMRFPEEPPSRPSSGDLSVYVSAWLVNAKAGVAYHIFTLASGSESVLCVSGRVRPTATTLRSLRTSCEI